MDNATAMDILDASCDLMDIVFCLHFGDPLAAFYELVQGLVRAELKNYVDILLVFEVVVEADYVGRAEGSVDLDFRI